MRAAVSKSLTNSEDQRQQYAKQVINSVAADLEQFAKGLSSETAVLSQHFQGAVDAFSKAFTYTECYRPEDLGAAPALDTVLAASADGMEGFRKAINELLTAIRGLPRFTTQFNSAKRTAIEAIDGFDRFARNGVELLTELRRNVSTLVSHFEDCEVD